MLFAPRVGDRECLQSLLADTAWELAPCGSWVEAPSVYRRSSNPILLCDLAAGGPWRDTLARLRSTRSDACVIFIADPGVDSLREELMGAGAFDVLTRPMEREPLLLSLLFAYSHCRAHWPKKSPRRAFQPVVSANIRLRDRNE